jgi:serine/threonine protein kinase
MGRFNLSSSALTITSSDHEEFSMMYDSKSLFQLENYDDDVCEITVCPSTDENHDRGNKNHGYVSSVDRNDLQKISLIGSGQFCNVYSVTGVLSQPWQYKKQDTRKRSLLAFKSIDLKRVNNPNDLISAATDLANEAKLLSLLDHKNIIRLRGVSKERFSQSFCADGSSGGEGFFIVLDILKDTLSHRLQYWRKNSGENSQNKRRPLRTTNPCTSVDVDESQLNMMYDRVKSITFGIAEGMEYLHSQQIVLRDLKPSNIGFDFETGTEVRLFDFGMARKVTDCDSEEACGSPRYMAPEVMSGAGYSLKNDVYSFGVLLFEICSLCSPYEDNFWNKKKENYKQKNRFKLKNLGTRKRSKNKQAVNMVNNEMEDFYSCVVENQLRPTDDLSTTIPCLKLRSLIQDCWITNPDERPSFTEILSNLKALFESETQPGE